MRIVTGSLRGRIIPSHRSLDAIRLTASHLKEAVFSMLGPGLDGFAFLDLCAGSGQMGMEAYSRGARVTLNEPDQRRGEQIRALLRAWRVEDVTLHRLPGRMLIQRLADAEQRFDVLYLDPPYRATREQKPLSQYLLEQLSSGGILQPAATILVQHQSELSLPETVGTLARAKRRTYGHTDLSVFRPR